MFKSQNHLMARLAANILLVIAIIATPPLLTAYVDMNASAEAATWPEKPSKYKKDKPLLRFKPPSDSFNRKYDKLDKARDNKDWAEYADVLKSMRERYDKYHDGEKSTLLFREIEYMMAMEDIRSDKNPKHQSNYGPIIKKYETLLTFHKTMRESYIKDILNVLASMYMMNGTPKGYRKSLYYHHQWLGMTNVEVKPTRKYQIGYVHFLLENFDLALEWIEESIADTWALGKVPKESVFQIQKHIYYEKQNFSKVAKILEVLVKHYPKKKHWEQLGVIYQQGLERPKDSLVVFELLREQDKLKKSSYIKSLAFTYQRYEVPYKMARLLEWGMTKGYLEKNAKNYKVLYFAYRDAQEVKKSIEALRQYTLLESDANMFNLLSDEYVKNRDYRKAAEAARKARTATKKSKKPGESHYREGVALYYLKEFEKSVAAFKQAKKDPKIKNNAKPWEAYVQGRIENLKHLEDTKQRLQKDLAKR